MPQKTRPATQVMIGSDKMPVRVSYPHVFEKHTPVEGQDPKYSCVFLISKDDKASIAAVKKAIQAATEKGAEAKWSNRTPKNLRSPLRDGDEEREDDDSKLGSEYAGCYYLNASSKDKPGVVDRHLNRIEEESGDFYPGCYCRATINFYPYDAAGNKGIGAGLLNIQKVKDGENLTGRSKAEDDFDELGDEETAETPWDDDDIF